MKQEEKIEVMLEAIFKSLEQISKKLDQGGSADREELVEMKESFERLAEKLGNAPGPSASRELSTLDKKLNVLIERRAYQPSSNQGEEKHHHYLWFFPDIKGWLQMVQSSRVAWILGMLLIISVGFNLYIGKDYSRYQKSDQKYQFMKHTGNLDYVHDLDSAWEIDSLRKAWIQFSTEEEAVLRAEVQNQRKKMDLRRQLDSLEQNK